MKFPKKLSKERISLLSPQDRKIYEYEHSGLCPEMRLLKEHNKIKNANIKHINEDVKFREFMELLTFNSLFDELFDKELKEIVGTKEYNRIRKSLYEYIQNDPELNVLNEAEGHAADWWIPDLGWLGKLTAGLLTGLLGVIAYLFMKGMDRLAMAKLKQYMNKLVELVDQGVNKKRPWYSFLMPTKKGKQNTGDYNKACLRTIQETAERNMACLYTQAIHNLGFLDPNRSDFNGISGGNYAEENSGLKNFENIVMGLNQSSSNNEDESSNALIGDIEAIRLGEGVEALLPIKVDKSHWNNLKLPALPTNYKMLMSNIEYPTKANKNPNGSLFMKPTAEILQAKAEDIGSQFFSPENDALKDIIIFNTAKNESIYYNSRNSVLNALLEVEGADGLDKTLGPELGSIVTPDIDPTAVAGSELETHTQGKEETLVETFKGNIIDAIDGYVNASIPAITKLIRGICGKQSSDSLAKFALLINTLNHAAEGNLSAYMKKNDEILLKISENEYQNSKKLQQTYSNISINVNKLSNWLHEPKFVSKIGLNAEKLIKFQDKLAARLTDLDSSEDDFNRDIRTSTNCENFGLLRDNAKQLKICEFKELHVENSSKNYFDYNKYFALFEDEQIKEEKEIKDELAKSMETSFEEVRSKLVNEMLGIIERDPTEWEVIKQSQERMKALKEAADKEITTKIELICRTANSGNSDLGDKFKSALSKHPIRAASLTNIWARYSDDIQDRIETRIRSITGDNGNSNILSTIKTFLTTTYPNLIAVMIYYKSMFYLVKLYTSKFPINSESVKAVEDSNTANDVRNLGSLLQMLRNNSNNQLQQLQPTPAP